MKVTFVATALALAAGVASQSLADLPSCALSCLSGGLQKTGCGVDIGCACKKADFVSGAVTCVTGKCNAEETAAATKVAVAICAAAGVEITIPGGEEPKPTTTAAPSTTTTSTTTSAETTTPAPTSTLTTSTTSTTSAAPTVTAPPVKNGTNGTVTVPPVQEGSGAGKIAASGILAAGLGLAVAFGL